MNVSTVWFAIVIYYFVPLTRLLFYQQSLWSLDWIQLQLHYCESVLTECSACSGSQFGWHGRLC